MSHRSGCSGIGKGGRPREPKGLRMGLIVNPIAGLGGGVGLKGTDGPEALAAARAQGARELAIARARRAMTALRPAADRLRIATCAGRMGEEAFAGTDVAFTAIIASQGCETGPEDTRNAARMLCAQGLDLLLFAGGDGTARDILDAVGNRVPVLGIPCGVKMHSGVFATSPEMAGRIVADLAQGADRPMVLRDVEVMDIDEEGLREGRLSARLYGYLKVPGDSRRLQGPKLRQSPSEDAEIDGAAAAIAREMAPGVLYVIGPGATAKRVLGHLGLRGTLLGVDAILDRHLAGTDLAASGLMQLAGGRPVVLVLGVIGGQGYVLGRGNQQITPALVRQAGRHGLTVIAGTDKLATLHAPRLLIDSGDLELDRALCGYIRVRTGLGQFAIMRLEAG